ncbi:MAG: HK97 gp10 family phage protein [Acutalibacteraceae bacterium]|nr:HK97 gp10 family phage protein [Acutalibacteraceae bacterium]
MKVDFTISGFDKLERKLKKMNSISFNAVVKKSATQLFNRMKNETPVDSGELRQSIILQKDIIGYTKDYAPHVEYGHRTLNGGWVKGQYFLKNGVEKQKPIYKKDLINAIKKGSG